MHFSDTSQADIVISHNCKVDCFMCENAQLLKSDNAALQIRHISVAQRGSNVTV